MNRLFFLGGSTAAGLALALWPHDVAATTLMGTVAATAHRLPGAISVYARILGHGTPLVEYRAFEQFPTASIIKVLVMTTAYAREEVIPGTLDQQLTFDRSSDLIGGSDFMSEQADGATFTVKELIVPMIQVSDNTAANMLIGYFGVHAINEIGLRAGMQATHLARKFMDFAAIVRHEDNVTTAADMGQLLYVIERGAHEGVSTIVSSDHCRAMINVMLGQTDREKIPAALPAGLQIANKTGEITGTRNDVAVIDPYGPAPLVLAILTKDCTDYSASNRAIHDITRAVYRAATRGTA